jgi:hypothetical protein
MQKRRKTIFIRPNSKTKGTEKENLEENSIPLKEKHMLACRKF